MDNQELSELFSELSTPLLFDACLRVGVPPRLAPPGIRPLSAGHRVAGRALPVRHYGSVDIFLEALGAAGSGDVLVIDNGGRLEEACFGDLTALEAQAAELAGIVAWGTHRDSTELGEIGLPVFSYGACPAGPQRLDPTEPAALLSAHFGPWLVDGRDVVFGDLDGVLFVPGERVEEVLEAARAIRQTEREQATLVRAGRTLRQQLRFDEYLARRMADPAYTFRRHLRAIGGAIEE